LARRLIAANDLSARILRNDDLALPPDRRALKASFETRAAGNMPTLVGPEVLQLSAFIAVVIPPIQLNLDSLDFVLLWQSHSVVDLGIDLIARPGERDGGVKIEPALL
jgi:hypothetical protein